MRLDDLCASLDALSLPAAGERVHPDRDTVAAARARVQEAVVDDDFLSDCMASELRLIAGGRPRRGLAPFFTMPETGIRFAFGYWAPGNTAGAHEHTAWTITAVCRNALEVVTYDRDESYRMRALVSKNRFEAPAGKVGFIFEPCIHEPRNVSGDWSLSLHLSSPRDGEPVGDDREPIPGMRPARSRSLKGAAHPYASVVEKRRRNRCVHQLGLIAAGMRVDGRSALLDACHVLGAAATRRLVRDSGRADDPSAAKPRECLVRTHPDLSLGVRQDGAMVALGAETASGRWVEEIAVGELARAALDFAARTRVFEPGEMPGDLTDEEQNALADALEDCGLFTRMRWDDVAGESGSQARLQQVSPHA